MKKKKDAIEQAIDRYTNLEKEMSKDIDLRFVQMKAEFDCVMDASPNPTKTVENKIKELEDLLHTDSTGNETFAELRSTKHYIRGYVADYILKGRRRALDKNVVRSGYLASEREWIIDAEASYKLYLSLMSPRKEFTHREHLIAHAFKVSAGQANHLTAKEMREVSAKRYQASFTLNEGKRDSYRPPKIEELQNVIQILEHFPEAQKLAKQALDKIL